MGQPKRNRLQGILAGAFLAGCGRIEVDSVTTNPASLRAVLVSGEPGRLNGVQKPDPGFNTGTLDSKFWYGLAEKMAFHR
jgi:hypothetical protein